MASLATKFIARKIFAEKFPGNKTNQANGAPEDPYFETVPATRLGMKTTKKRKRALPPGLTPEEESVLTKAKRRAYRLDLCLFSLCGLRFGWSSVIGLIPAVGDVADMLLALIVFRTICQVEPPLSSSTKTKMQMNIVIDFVIGLVPFIGDLADAAYKCNTKNVVLLEEELRERGRKRIRQSGQAYPAVDPSLADEWDYQDEDHLRQEHGNPPEYASREPSRRDRDRRDRSRSRRDRRDDRDLESARGVTPPRPARTR
ncbi:hypothetical protein LTR70_006743 [Exophiala xenobiotica]|uniref:Uncharacterized protein n=1 Tax=Lithohypha guttulata TaxID=1690604 RepID=A0ABR0KAB8_9EURO|nr:hypothetical protein LTR24_005009 [Lithohypha guttulata]KAK5315404.1 hypothetical protein LTR70_006743 [Exophiala xenobiotica]